MSPCRTPARVGIADVPLIDEVDAPIAQRPASRRAIVIQSRVIRTPSGRPGASPGARAGRPARPRPRFRPSQRRRRRWRGSAPSARPSPSEDLPDPADDPLGRDVQRERDDEQQQARRRTGCRTRSSTPATWSEPMASEEIAPVIVCPPSKGLRLRRAPPVAPAAMATTIVSPIARESPRISAATMPGRGRGDDDPDRRRCASRAPIPYAASRRWRGHRVERVLGDRRDERDRSGCPTASPAARNDEAALRAEDPADDRRAGSPSSAKNPSTTLGMPASVSRIGLSVRRARGESRTRRGRARRRARAAPRRPSRSRDDHDAPLEQREDVELVARGGTSPSPIEPRLARSPSSTRSRRAGAASRRSRC